MPSVKAAGLSALVLLRRLLSKEYIMANQTIRISLKAYDHQLLDKSTEKIVKTAKSTGAVISGPIPMPTKRTIYTVLRSPFVDKKSREQFQSKIHKRVVDILNSTPKTVEALMNLDLPAGVDIQIKV